MEAVQPRRRVIRRSFASKRCPCPHCGKNGRRKAIHHRTVRDIAYREIVIIELQIGEYRACCSCCKTFRAPVEGIEPRAAYTNRVREAVIDRLLDDGMSMERLRQALQRDFHLELSDGFLYDCLDWKVRQVDMPAYRQWTLEQFSGTLCVDEIHLGCHILLLATDPLSDLPLAFAQVSANDQDHMRRFLGNLKRNGISPRVVVTDGSGLYPKVIEEVWPQAQHQLCIFHVIRDLNQGVLDALRRLRRHLAKQSRSRRGRPRRGGRRSRPTKKKQAHFIWKHRYLIVLRPEAMTGHQRKRLGQMFAALPELRTLRTFVLQVYDMFAANHTGRQACNRYLRLMDNPEFQADPDLARALKMLTPEKFDKMITFLNSPLGRQVRTNNHVERTNRRLRYFEKVRYKWRRRRTIIRFLVLAFDRWRERTGYARTTPSTRVTPSPSRPQPKLAA